MYNLLHFNMFFYTLTMLQIITMTTVGEKVQKYMLVKRNAFF